MKSIPEDEETWINKMFGSKRRLIIYLLIFLTLAVICVIPHGRENFQRGVAALLPTPSPVVIKLSGTPEQMGGIHGSEFKYSLKVLEKLYIKLIICGNNNERLSEYCAKAKQIFARIDQRWTREIKAVAKASGTDSDALMLGNTFLDIGISSAGCRMLIIFDETMLLHAHNLDWDNLGGIGNYLITIFRTEGGKDRFATVHIGFPGMIGALDIINEKGIALSFNQVGFARDECEMPIFIKMREIAEKCSTFEDARKEIMTMPQGMPFCIGLSDAKTGQTAIFERDNKTSIKRRNASDGILTADNSLWYGVKMRERCVLDDTARKVNPDKVEDMKTILRHKSVILSCNIYSVIFDYKNNKLYLASGKIPAAEGQYREFKLFDYNANIKAKPVR
jgi:hypothetical protein